MKLFQKQIFQSKAFEVKNDTIVIKTKNFSNSKEWTVKLENIGDQIIIDKKSKIGRYILSLFFLAFVIFFLTTAFLADEPIKYGSVLFIAIFYLVFTTLIFLSPDKSEIKLVGGLSELSFLLTDREEADKFIKTLIERSRKLILDKYGKVDSDLPEDIMIGQLNWLKNREILSEQEYDERKTEYKNRKLMN